MKATAEDMRHYVAEWLFTDLVDSPAECIRVHGSTVNRPIEIKFSDLDHIQIYVDRALSDPRFVATYGERSIRVVQNNRLKSRAYYQAGTINLPARGWAWRESVVLHEIAHNLACVPGHGARFTACFLQLVDWFMGPEAAFILYGFIHQQQKKESA